MMNVRELICKTAHIIAGFLTALSSTINIMLPLVGFLIFLVYEGDEYKVLGDYLFEEMREFGFGFFTGIIILIMMKLLTG